MLCVFITISLPNICYGCSLESPQKCLSKHVVGIQLNCLVEASVTGTLYTCFYAEIWKLIPN